MYSFKRNFKHPWNRRIYDLAGSTGWSLGELGRQLGFKGTKPYKSVTRILQGGRPSVPVLLRLQALEKQHEEQIKRFIYQGRPYAKFHTLRQRYGDTLLKGRTKRPSDIAEMGKVEAVGKDGGHGPKKRGDRLRWPVDRDTAYGLKHTKARAFKARRSQAK